MATFYDVLGVDKLASATELKSAYRKLARASHPDLGGNVETFRKVQEAWETLGTPAKRSSYDSKISTSYSSSKSYKAPSYSHETHNKYDSASFYFDDEEDYEDDYHPYYGAEDDRYGFYSEQEEAEEKEEDRKYRAWRAASERAEAERLAEEARRAKEAANAYARAQNYERQRQERVRQAKSRAAQEHAQRKQQDAQERSAKKAAEERALWTALGKPYSNFQFSKANYWTVKLWKTMDIFLKRLAIFVISIVSFAILLVQVMITPTEVSRVALFGGWLLTVLILSGVSSVGILIANSVAWRIRREENQPREK